MALLSTAENTACRWPSFRCLPAGLQRTCHLELSLYPVNSLQQTNCAGLSAMIWLLLSSIVYLQQHGGYSLILYWSMYGGCLEFVASVLMPLRAEQCLMLKTSVLSAHAVRQSCPSGTHHTCSKCHVEIHAESYKQCLFVT